MLSTRSDAYYWLTPNVPIALTFMTVKQGSLSLSQKSMKPIYPKKVVQSTRARRAPRYEQVNG